MSSENAMTLMDHLLELRKRMLRSLAFVIATFIGLVYFANDIYLFVAQPMLNALPVGSHLQAIDPTATFFAPFKLTFFVAIFVTVPFILHQLWLFISPGLYAHEKRIALPVLLSSILLFYSGIAFAYYVVLDLILTFLVSTAPEGVLPVPDISSYLQLVLKLFFAFGCAFEIPIATVLLLLSGVVSTDQLKRQRPYVFIGCFVIGMLLTPPDVLSQTLLAFPMWLLFESGLLLGTALAKVRANPKA
ncbi:MAG: twin-arginine translocase subunit TatC, partial [Gammaproteobacteria bacterium]